VVLLWRCACEILMVTTTQLILVADHARALADNNC
jgi:hypothetical protein